MRKLFFPLLILTFGSVLFLSCSEDSMNTPPVSDNNGFETESVSKIFANNCATSGCHTGDNPAGSVSFSKYSEMLKGSTNRSNGAIPNYGGEVVIPYRLNESLLYQMLLGNVDPIAPHDAILLSQADIDTIKSWIERGARDNNGNIPLRNPSYRVYVCNQGADKISVIDGDKMVVSAIIDEDKIPSLDAPHMCKVQDGYLYNTLIGSARFIKTSTTDYQQAGEFQGITKAGMIIMHPNGTKAFVSRSSTSDPVYQTIYAIDITNMTEIKEINLNATGVPHGMALTPDGTKLYVCNLSLSRISIVNGMTNEYGDYDDIMLPPDTQPMQAMISSDGNYLYVSARGTGKLMVFDTHTDTLITEVGVDAMPMQIAVTSDGKKIYVGSMMMGTVNVVEKDGESWTRTKVISHPGFRRIHGADLTGDDKYLYVSCRNDDPANYFQPYFKVNGETPPGCLGIIDTQTDEVVKFIELEPFSAGLVVEKVN